MKFFFIAITFLSSVFGSISNPHLQDTELDKLIPEYYEVKNQSRDFKAGSPVDESEFSISPIKLNREECGNVDLDIVWEAEVSNAVTSSPVIYPLFRFYLYFGIKMTS